MKCFAPGHTAREPVSACVQPEAPWETNPMKDPPHGSEGQRANVILSVSSAFNLPFDLRHPPSTNFSPLPPKVSPSNTALWAHESLNAQGFPTRTASPSLRL